tara:strand:- start:46 stop:468 length:423 start_codon:yes stop_codon:yes gene_type:complete
MTTENYGVAHDPDYNISVSSSPDTIRETYNPPAGSIAAQTYNPNMNYPVSAWERAFDGGELDEDYEWPINPPDKTQEMLHRISEGFNRILLKLDSVEETRATVEKQEAKIESILVLLEKALREIKTEQVKPKVEVTESKD